ncbi:MAG: TonB-dependent receptor [Sphingomonadales bacterium]
MAICSNSKNHFRQTLLAATAAAMVPAWAIPALAQDNGEAATVTGLEEIFVTARKREESLQNVPVAVTAFASEQINRYDLTSLEKLAAFTPQLVIGRASNGSGAQITLRGIGSQPTSIGLEQSTATVVDGVYFGHGLFINEALFDLERIELLKGPQALFFGKNATAGVVAVTTANPTDELDVMARAGFEFRSQNLVTEGHISGPLAPTLTGRLAVRFANMFDGYFNDLSEGITTATLDIATGNLNPRFQPAGDDNRPGTNEKFARATLQWKPTERLTATLKISGMRAEDDSNAWNYVPFACPSGFTQPNPNVPCERKFNVYSGKFPEGLGGNIPNSREDGSQFNLYKSFSATGTLDYSFDQVDLTSVTNYNWHRNIWGLTQHIFSATSFIAATQNTSFWSFSNETRAQTNLDGPINGMLGVLYQKTKRDHDMAAAFAPLEDSSLPDNLRFLSYDKPSQTDGETIAVFGQATWQILPELELAGGARYTHETKKSFLVQSFVNAALQGLFPQDFLIEADQTFNDWSPEATLTYQPADNLTVYGAFKTAYKSGGFSNSALVTALTVPTDITFEPETAKGFELGLKTTLADNQLRLNVVAFTYKYKNLQVDFFDSVTFQFITTNAGAARAEGVELEAQYAPRGIPGLTMQGSLNYNDTRYLQFIAPCYGGQSIAAGCNTNFQGAVGQDLSGQSTAMAPEWTASIGANYETAVSDDFILGISADGRWSDNYLGSNFGHPLSFQKSYINLDATLRFGTADGQWELAVIGRNLTNSFRIGGVIDQPNSGSGTGTAVAVPADQVGYVDFPRTVRAQLTWRY